MSAEGASALLKAHLLIEEQLQSFIDGAVRDASLLAKARFSFAQKLVLAEALHADPKFQPLAAAGSMTIELSPTPAGKTDLRVIYNVAGYEPAGLDKRAPFADTVITDQFVRMKNYVEKGTPAPDESAIKQPVP